MTQVFQEYGFLTTPNLLQRRGKETKATEIFSEMKVESQMNRGGKYRLFNF